MTYVPIVPHVPTPPSPRTRELAGLLAQVVADYERSHPSVTRAEVHDAARLAVQATGGSGSPGAYIVLLLVGVLALLAGVAVFFARSGLEPSFDGIAVIGVIGVIGILAALLAVVRRSP